jgi:hypothetical protein
VEAKALAPTLMSHTHPTEEFVQIHAKGRMSTSGFVGDRGDRHRDWHRENKADGRWLLAAQAGGRPKAGSITSTDKLRVWGTVS